MVLNRVRVLAKKTFQVPFSKITYIDHVCQIFGEGFSRRKRSNIYFCSPSWVFPRFLSQFFCLSVYVYSLSSRSLLFFVRPRFNNMANTRALERCREESFKNFATQWRIIVICHGLVVAFSIFCATIRNAETARPRKNKGQKLEKQLQVVPQSLS